jgi:Fic family protein
MAFDPKIPYNDLPLLPPKSDVETKAILKKTIAARSALAELKGLGETLPGYVYSKELIETIFRQPYTKGQFLVDLGIAKRQTAAEYLKELEKIEILKPYKIGRETLYLNVDLCELLSK